MPGRIAIAKTVFQMGPNEQPNPEEEIDAVGELANVISGHVKTLMNRIDATMRIGLPSAVGAESVWCGALTRSHCACLLEVSRPRWS